MLIVVAIIAILIAISIPLVNSALERAKHATDAANERAAKAQILIQNLGEVDSPVQYGYYDATEGKVKDAKTSAPTITAYGKHHNGKVIKISYNSSTGVVGMEWVASGSLAAFSADVTSSADLCGVTKVGASGHPGT